MSTFEHDLVNHLVKNKKYDALQEFGQTVFPDRSEKIIVQEYVGSDICVRKHDNDIQIFCPREMSVVQESALTQAIEKGTIFDDAEDVDNVTNHVVATAVPTNALTNTGKQLPEKINGVVSMVIGKMNDDGRCSPDETDVENGQNMIKDLCDAKSHNCGARDVVDHYLGNDDHEPVGMDMTKEIMAVEEEVNDINSVKPEDSITEDDYTELDPTRPSTEEVSNGWRYEKVSSYPYGDDDIGGETPIEHYGIDNYDDTFDNIQFDDDDEFNDINDEPYETDTSDSSNISDTHDEDIPSDDEDIDIEECGSNCSSTDSDYFSEDDDMTDATMTDNTEGMDMTSNDMTDTASTTDSSSVGECGENGVPIGQNATPGSNRNTVEECGDTNTFEEGFLSKRPKKLKPIPRDVIAYITVELNNIQDANDQAMLSGYTCSKLELVDFYLNCIDTNDPRYIVPHNKQYLEQMQKELNSLLAQILRIRPINKSDRIWNVNYPY